MRAHLRFQLHVPMTRFCFVVALFLLGVPRVASAGSEPAACALWQGELAKHPVAVTLRGGPGTDALNGRYAYLHIGKPIPLIGTRKAAGLSLEERGGPGGKLSGSWALSFGPTGSGALTGTWSSPDGKRTVTVELYCLADATGTLRDPWYAATVGAGSPDQQFDAFVRNPEVAGRVEDRGEGISVRQITLASIGAEYDVVDRHPLRKAASAINAAIRARVAQARKEERRCQAEGLRCEITASLGIEFLSPRFATVSVSGYYDGGGAHPDSDVEIWVFELTDGGAKRLKPEKFYDLKAHGRWKRDFWKLVRAAAKAKDKADAEPRDPDLDACPDDSDSATVQLGIAAGGVDVDVSFSSHAIAACGYSVFVSAEKLARFVRPGAPEVFRTGKF